MQIGTQKYTHARTHTPYFRFPCQMRECANTSTNTSVSTCGFDCVRSIIKRNEDSFYFIKHNFRRVFLFLFSPPAFGVPFHFILFWFICILYMVCMLLLNISLYTTYHHHHHHYSHPVALDGGGGGDGLLPPTSKHCSIQFYMSVTLFQNI